MYCLGTATDRIASRLRKELFDSYMETDIELYDAEKNGEMVCVLLFVSLAYCQLFLVTAAAVCAAWMLVCETEEVWESEPGGREEDLKVLETVAGRGGRGGGGGGGGGLSQGGTSGLEPFLAAVPLEF